jgi:hypothetical protein
MSQLRVNTITDAGGTGSTYAPGHVVQVVQTTKTDTFTTTSGFTPITGLSATITPKSSTSKILVLAQVTFGLANNVDFGGFRLYGGTTDLYIGNAAGVKTRAVFGGYSLQDAGLTVLSGSINYLASPNSTSAQTIGVEVARLSNGTVFINRSAGDGDADNSVRIRGASSITLMEIAQ